MNGLCIEDFLDESALLISRERIDAFDEGLALVVGVGASLVVCTPDVLGIRRSCAMGDSTASA